MHRSDAPPFPSVTRRVHLSSRHTFLFHAPGSQKRLVKRPRLLPRLRALRASARVSVHSNMPASCSPWPPPEPAFGARLRSLLGLLCWLERDEMLVHLGACERREDGNVRPSASCRAAAAAEQRQLQSSERPSGSRRSLGWTPSALTERLRDSNHRPAAQRVPPVAHPAEVHLDLAGVGGEQHLEGYGRRRESKAGVR